MLHAATRKSAGDNKVQKICGVYTCLALSIPGRSKSEISGSTSVCVSIFIVNEIYFVQ